MEYVRVEELRKTLRAVLSEVRYQGKHFEVLRYEETEAYIVPPEWYEAARAALNPGRRS